MRYFVRLVAILVLSMPACLVWAASPSIVISELQTGTTTSASQEFIELYNPTATDITIDNWKLEYKSATSIVQASSWSKRAALTGTIKSHGFYLIAPKTYLSVADAELSTGLAGSGGHVRLVDASETVIDLLAWGDSSNASEANPASVPAAGLSLERLPGRLEPTGGNAYDSDDNSKDFLMRSDPEPQSTANAAEIPSSTQAFPDPDTITTETPIDPEATADDPSPEPKTYAVVSITEVLINPATPLTDADDEYIELFNPGSALVDLEGYVLQTGSGFHDHYTLSSAEIEPKGHVVLYSNETNLSLTNTGGAARLLDPLGKVVSQTSEYPSAPEGQSWSQFEGGWQWTLQLSPGRPNVLVQPLIAASSSDSKNTSKSSSATPKKTTTKTSTAKAPATPKAAKSNAIKTTTPKPKAVAASGVDATAAGNALPTKWLLLGALGLTIGYGIYEFRHDLQNYYYLARRKLKAGP